MSKKETPYQQYVRENNLTLEQQIEKVWERGMNNACQQRLQEMDINDLQRQLGKVCLALKLLAQILDIGDMEAILDDEDVEEVEEYDEEE